jgi:hypothetical protein
MDHRALNLHHEIHHKSEPKTHTPTSTSNSDNMMSQHEDQPSDVFDADDGGSNVFCDDPPSRNAIVSGSHLISDNSLVINGTGNPLPMHWNMQDCDPGKKGDGQCMSQWPGNCWSAAFPVMHLDIRRDFTEHPESLLKSVPLVPDLHLLQHVKFANDNQVIKELTHVPP